MAGLDESVDRDERIEALQQQIDELKRQQKSEQLEGRRALKNKIDEMRSPEPDERQARKEAILEQIDEIKRLYDEQQERQKALMAQLIEMKQQEKEERKKQKKGLHFGIALKLGKPGDECPARDHAREFLHQQDYGDIEFRKGFLKLHILEVLAEEPSHGYDIMNRISDRTGDAWKPSPGSVYPALETLELKGFVYCQGDGRRKVYSLTKKGNDALARMKAKQAEQFSEMKSFLSGLFEE